MPINRSVFLMSLTVVITAISFIRAENPAVSLTPSGFATLEAGQLLKGSHIGIPIDHNWLQSLRGHFGLHSTINNKVDIYFSLECLLSYSYPQSFSYYQKHEPRFRIKSLPRQYFFIDQAEGVYSFFGNSGSAPLQLGVGFFPYKYNPDVRNLGEYLFRSGTYPGYLVADIDYPLSRLLGIRISSTLFSFLHQDLLLTSEAQIFPLGDYSLSYILNCQTGTFGEIGAGISFAHLWSIDEDYTTPHTLDNAIVINEDTTDEYYTFRGTKLMARFVFDPKSFFNTGIFGKNDLRLYAEMTVLGVKDYPVFFDNILERIPVMAGINIPTFKLLDVAAFELEWYNSRYPNDYRQVFILHIPQPVVPSDSTYTHNDWKWSLYLKRTFANRLSIIGQAARDHIRLYTADPLKQNRRETLEKKDHWYYIFKFQYSF